MTGQVSDSRAALPLWLASVPDPFTPAQGRDAAQAALDDASAVISNVKAKFQGTLPPPPWPKSAALSKAIDDVEVARDAMAAFADHSKGIDLKWKKTDKGGATLVRVGTALYGELGKLEDAAKNSDSVESLLKLIPSPSSMLKGLPTLLIVVFALWALSEGRKLHRLIEG